MDRVIYPTLDAALAAAGINIHYGKRGSMHFAYISGSNQKLWEYPRLCVDEPQALAEWREDVKRSAAVRYGIVPVGGWLHADAN